MLVPKKSISDSDSGYIAVSFLCFKPLTSATVAHSRTVIGSLFKETDLRHSGGTSNATKVLLAKE